jgi:hypothetical protein
LSTLPAESWAITDDYKQSIYDPRQNKIGDVDDVLVDRAGKLAALLVGAGGFLGVAEKQGHAEERCRTQMR